MNNIHLTIVEEKLLAMKNIIKHNIKKITFDKNKLEGPIIQDLDDQSIELQNNEVIDELDRIERAELIKIDNAIKRIHNGTYGKCIKCGNQIQEKRLKAIPYANICIICANDKL
jgi:DnaK suppressor protein